MAIENISGRMHVPINTANTSQKTGVDNADKAVAKETGQTDSIAITSTARNIKKSLESSSSATLIDIDRVQAVKKALADGSYQINAEKIAEKMIQHEMLMSKLDSTEK
jgi:negative regulator of flagellin synthesis FlgM